MASRSDIEAGKAYVRLYVRDSALMQGLGRIRSTLQSIGGAFLSFGRSMAGVSLTMSAPLAAAISHFTRYGSTVADMAARTGMTTNAVSELAYAAEQSGSSIEELESSMRRMTKTVDEARSGTKSAVEALASIGIAVSDLPEDPDQQLSMIANGLQRIPDPTRRAVAAMAIFGKAGTAMLPMLADGAEGLRQLRREAQEAGQSIDAEDAAAADRLGDAWDRFKATIKGASFSIGASLAPAMEDLLGIVTSCAKAVRTFVKDNGDAIQTTVKWVTGIGVLGGGLIGLGSAVKAVASVMGAIGSFLSPVLFIAGAIRSRVSKLASIGPLIGKSFSASGREIAATFATIGASISRAASTAARLAATGAKVGSSFANGFVGSISAASGRIGTILTAGASAAPKVGSMLASGLSGVSSTVTRIVGALTNPSVGASTFRRIASSAMAAAQSVRGAATSLSRGWTGEIGLATETSSRLFFRIGTASRAALQLAMNPSQWGTAARTAATSAATTIQQKLTSTFTRIKVYGPAAMRGAFAGVAAFASSAANASVRAFRAAAPKMASAVTTAMSKAFRGIGAMAAAGAGGAAKGIGKGIGGAVGGVMGAVGAISGILGEGVLGSFAMIAPQIGLLGGALMGLLNPFTLVAAAIGGGVYLWVKYSAAGKAAFAKIQAIIAPFVAIFKQAFQGISDAISAGDIGMAFQIGLAGAKVAVLTALEQINGYFKANGNETAATVTGTISGIVGKLASGDIQGAWQTIVNAMKAIWTGLKNWVMSGLKSIVDRFNSIRKWAASKILEGAFGGEMAAEQARRDKLEQEQFALKAKPIRAEMRKLNDDIEAATQAGDTAKVDELNAKLAELRQQLQDLANAPDIDLRADAQDDINRQLDVAPIALGVDLSIADVNRKLDDLKRKAQQDADDAANALAADVGDGAAAASDAFGKARADFDDLTAAAAKAKAAKDSAGDRDQQKLLGDMPEQARAAREQASATFSAAALARIGGGGDVPKMTLAQIKALTKQQREDNKLMKAGQDMLIRVARESGIRFAR